MAHEPRQITFLGREGPTKHYGIGNPAPTLIEATRALAEPGVPGFTIAHQGARRRWRSSTGGPRRTRSTGARTPGCARTSCEPLTDTGMACVWELEVIDFERRAWLEDVLINDDVDAYLERALEPVAV